MPHSILSLGILTKVKSVEEETVDEWPQAGVINDARKGECF